MGSSKPTVMQMLLVRLSESKKKKKKGWVVAAHDFNPRILEAEASAGRSLQITGQLGVCSKSLSQTIKQNSIITIWEW